jgi:ceramide glucosyltransferase
MRYLFLLLSVSAIVYYCLAIYAAIAFFFESKTRLTQLDSAFYPAITILKPICGADDRTYENLASFCQQDYPNYQIIFGIQSQSDPSIAIVQKLIQDFPNVDIQSVISDRVYGTNLKVSNLANAAAQGKYDIFLIADSDISVGAEYLQQIIQPLSDPKVGVVTCPYRSHAQGWISTFEALGISTEFLPGVLVARQIEGMTFALGATIVIRRSVLEAIGGFAVVADHLEDDFQLGNLPVQAGYQVVLSHYIVSHVMPTATLTDLLHHQIRWARGIRFARPGGYLGLIFTYGTLFSLLFLWTTDGSMNGWIVFGITWLIRYVMAWLIGVNYLQDTAAKKWLWLTPLRDLMSFLLWCYSFMGNTIEWRGRKLQLIKGGKLIDSKL